MQQTANVMPYIKGEAVRNHFKVEGIPSLIVLDKSGEVITREGMEDVQAKGPGVVALWKVRTFDRIQLFDLNMHKTSCS